MEDEEDFARLEQFVEKLLNSYNELKAECSELKASLRHKEQENGELLQKFEALQDKKSVVRKKVSGLIRKIEKWEKSHNTSPAQA